MTRSTDDAPNPRDLFHGNDALEALKNLDGKRAVICVGGGSMKRFGFLDRAEGYLEEAGMEAAVFEGIESDPSVETVMKGAAFFRDFRPDWIAAMGGGSPIDAAKAMWMKNEYPETTFADMCKVFGLPKLRTKARFCAVFSTSGTAAEITAFSIITDYRQGIKYPLADYMHLAGSTDDEKAAALIAYLLGMNDKLNAPRCIGHYGADSYPAEQGFVPERVFQERLPEIAKNAIGDACTGSNPRQPSREETEKLLKCCRCDTDGDY